MESGDIAHEIIEAVARDLSCGVEVDAVHLLHYLCMVRNLEIGHYGLAEALDFNILAVVAAYRHARIDDVRDDHHYLLYLLAELLFELLEFSESRGVRADLSLHLFRLVALALRHERAYLLRQAVAAAAQLISLALCGAAELVKLNDLVDERKLLILKLLFDVFFDYFGVFSDKSEIQHFISSCIIFNRKHPQNGSRRPKGAISTVPPCV